ncbi:MAG TPA: TVP38/TMEM64 family protein [Prolixibacteraceae bacterium]|nr:TVP38/TMEM64 family protein [Prolixibacteraceae bacterium]
MDDKNNTQDTKQSKKPLIISALVLAGAVASYFFIPEVNGFLNEAWNTLTSGNEEMISNWVDNLGFWGPLFIVLAMTLQMFLLVIPSPLLVVVSVLAYGPFWGSLIAISAIMVASTTGYFIGKYLGQNTIDRLIGHKKEQQLEFYVERYGSWAVFITRLTPLLSNDAISLVAGILRMNYWKFILATLAGITPLTVLIAYFGENNERLKNGLIWVSAISLVIFVAYVIFDRKKNPVNQKQNKHQE